MNTHSNLSNALESDLRAIAARSRATEMKRLWQGIWRLFSPSSERIGQYGVAQPATSETQEQSIPVVCDEQFQKAA